MAAPTYTTDLADISTAESTTGWAELSGHTGGGAPTQESDFYIQGSYCISQSSSKTGTGAGLQYDYGSNVSISTGDCFFFWQIWLAGNSMDTFANGGLRVGVGSSSGNINFWKVGGKDFGRNPYGGWQNVVVDPTYTADYTEGTPAGTYRIFASLPNIVSAVSKGNPHGVDAIRWGRGEIKIEYGDGTNGYGTFSGIAAQNDSQSNRWGLFQSQGVGYLWKGLLSFGSATNACDFRDSNVIISVDDTPRTYSSFNKIEINNTGSRVDWTGVSIIAVNSSQLSLGSFEMVDNATVNINTCTFTDMNTFVFQSNGTITDTTFRRCAQITQGGASFDGCIFEESTAAVSLYVSNLNNIDNCSFTSDGSNHAIELSSDHAGNTYTLTGCTYTNYAISDGSTGNECIYNNSGGAVTINVDGGDLPTIRNGSGASTTVNYSVPIIITVKDTGGTVIQGVQTAIYKTSDRTEIVNQDTDASGEVSTSYSGSTPVEVEVRCRKASSGATKYKNYSSIQTIQPTTGLTLSVTLDEDPNNNATS